VTERILSLDTTLEYLPLYHTDSNVDRLIAPDVRNPADVWLARDGASADIQSLDSGVTLAEIRIQVLLTTFFVLSSDVFVTLRCVAFPQTA